MSSYIIQALRTPVIPYRGAFAHLDIHDLAAPVIRALLQQSGVDADNVGELVLSNALGAGGNPARVAALAAGLPERVAGLSIDRQCVGGLDAILLADAMVRSGMHDIVIAGGAESYSRRPLRARASDTGGAPEFYDQAQFTPWPDQDPDMAEAADELARHLDISRQAQDALAMESHAKALEPGDWPEIVTLAGQGVDSFPRRLSERLCARARSVSGSITVANMAVAADGAAFCLVVSEAVANRLGGTPVRVLGGATVGGDPTLPGLAPVDALRRALADADTACEALTVAEIMEAFAVQAIACRDGADINPAIVNPRGGGLARGHPVGASGAINAVRLVHELRARGGVGVAAIAAAGGLGTALVLEAPA